MKTLLFDDEDKNKKNDSVIDADFNCGPFSTRVSSSNEILGGVIAGGLVAVIAVGVTLFFSKD